MSWGVLWGHYATKKTTYKILQDGYYWPTLHRDAQHYVSHCDEYQRSGNLTKRDEIPLEPQVSLEPFDKWGLEFVGLINPPSNQKNHILVCTNYLRKWVEVKAMRNTIEEKVPQFLHENIFSRFGVPREIVIDQGPCSPHVSLNTPCNWKTCTI